MSLKCTFLLFKSSVLNSYLSSYYSEIHFCEIKKSLYNNFSLFQRSKNHLKSFYSLTTEGRSSVVPDLTWSGLWCERRERRTQSCPPASSWSKAARWGGCSSRRSRRTRRQRCKKPEEMDWMKVWAYVTKDHYSFLWCCKRPGVPLTGLCSTENPFSGEY